MLKEQREADAQAELERKAEEERKRVAAEEAKTRQDKIDALKEQADKDAKLKAEQESKQEQQRLEQERKAAEIAKAEAERAKAEAERIAQAQREEAAKANKEAEKNFFEDEDVIMDSDEEESRPDYLTWEPVIKHIEPSFLATTCHIFSLGEVDPFDLRRPTKSLDEVVAEKTGNKRLKMKRD